MTKPKVDLATLTKAQKLQLLDIIAEKKRRARENKALYKPNAGQSPVHLSRKILRCVFSGNGAGKTTMAVNEAFWVVQGYNPILGEFTPVPAVCAVVLDKPDKIEKRWLPEIRKWFNVRPDQLRKNGKPYVSQIVFDNGSVIDFYFHDQEEMTFESVEIDAAVFDEPPPRHVYIGLRRGGRIKGRKARFLMVGTPISQAWMREEIYEPWSKGTDANIECFTFGTRVNAQNLEDDYFQDFGSTLSEKEKLTRFEGAFFDLDGLALKHLFKQDIHVLPGVPEDWDYRGNPCVVVMDPHPTKAHVALLIGADAAGQLVALEEYSEKAIARKFAQSLVDREWFHKYRVVDIVYDSLGSAQTTSGEGFRPFGEVVNEVLKDNHVGRARATSYAEKSDEDFVERIRDSLAIPAKPDNFGRRLPKLLVTRRCPGLIGDIESVQWKRDKKNDQNAPALDIAKKDYLACLKYGLATNLYHKKGKEKVYYRSAPVYGVRLRPGRARTR